jgi:anaphase-promoting complex subunit 4
MGLESSKAVHHIRVFEGDGGEAAGRIEFIAWERNVTGEGRRRREREKKKEKLGSERRILLDGERTGDVASDLPHELMFLEVETSLPKLSPLPVSGGSG